MAMKRAAVRIALAVAAAVCPFNPASASPKHVQAITCEGEVGVAHTLSVGNCSFTGLPAKQVDARCKEDDVCRVEALGWDNNAGMFIIERVISVQKMANPDCVDTTLIESLHQKGFSRLFLGTSDHVGGPDTVIYTKNADKSGGGEWYSFQIIDPTSRPRACSINHGNGYTTIDPEK
jgi:hypothetical protein